MYCSKVCDSFPGVQLFNPDLSCNMTLHFCRLNAGLTNVPLEEIPTNATSVNLKNNSIQKLDNNSFTGLTVLVNISLSNNCCDICQIDRLFKIELFPLSSCQVIILIARMTFNCSTSCLMS